MSENLTDTKFDLAAEWYGLDEVEELGGAEWAGKVRALFTAEELPMIGDYEFMLFGKKLLRRVKPALVKERADGPAKAVKAKRAAKVSNSAVEALADGAEVVKRAAREMFVMSPLNPRKTFTAMDEFAASLKEHGVIQPLIVRPLAVAAPGGAIFEVIEGHRRLRGAEIAGLADVPYILRRLSDNAALEIMLVANLQRKDLNPIEEAEGVHGMLSLRDANGDPLYTREMVAKKIGKSVSRVSEILSLLRVPQNARIALTEPERAKRIAREVGYMIARQPSEQLRKRLAGEVIKGSGGRPMTTGEVEDHVRRNYTAELRLGGFDPRDAKLLPVLERDGERVLGGSCVDCPWNSVNGEAGSRQGSGPRCTNVPCFWEKQKAHVAALKGSALDAGAIVIEGEKARSYVYHDGTVSPECGMVKLSEAPSAAEINGTRKAPTWRKLLSGEATGEIVTGRDSEGRAIRGKVSGKINVPVTVVIDEKGRAHELVERKVAIEAARKNGYDDLFSARASRAKSAGQAEQMEREAVERDRAKLQSATAAGALGDLVAVVSAVGLQAAGWTALVEVALFHAGSDGEAFVCARRGLTVEKNAHGQPEREKALRAHLETLTAERVPALVVELLLGGWMKHSGVEARGFAALAEAYRLDVKAIAARVKGEMGVKKKAGGKGAKKAAAAKEEPTERERIERLAAAREMTVVQLNMLSARVLGKKLEEHPWAEARGPELRAILEAVDDLTEYDPAEGWIDELDGLRCPMCGVSLRRSLAVPFPSACVCGFSGAVPEGSRTE